MCKLAFAESDSNVPHQNEIQQYAFVHLHELFERVWAFVYVYVY